MMLTNERAVPEDGVEPPGRWRVRSRTWFVTCLGILPFCFTALIPLVKAQNRHELVFRVPVAVLMFVPSIVAAYVEKRRRPPAPSFWMIEGEFKLTIRSLATGEVLLRSPQG